MDPHRTATLNADLVHAPVAARRDERSATEARECGAGAAGAPGSDESPDDHGGFVEVRALGLRTMRQKLAARRRPR